MSKIPNSTENVLQQNCIKLLSDKRSFGEFNIKFISQEDNIEYRGGKTSSVLLKNVMRDRLKAINSFDYKGQKYQFSLANIEKAIEDMENDGIDICDTTIDIDQNIINKYKFKDLSKKMIIDNQKLSMGKLNFVNEYLQYKLKYNFFIYPNGYYKGLKESCNEKVISKELISKNMLNSESITNEINETLVEFRKFKPTEMGKIADSFFIYDYYKQSIRNRKNIKREEKSLIYKDIKYELTRYHGLTILDNNKQEKTLSYEACKKLCYNNSDFTIGKSVNFYITERTIKDRLNLMEKFIDHRFYRYLIF